MNYEQFLEQMKEDPQIRFARDLPPELMDVLLVKPGKYPKPVQIGTELEDMQEAVGKYIQCMYPYEEPIGIICNEKGKLKCRPEPCSLRRGWRAARHHRRRFPVRPDGGKFRTLDR